MTCCLVGKINVGLKNQFIFSFEYGNKMLENDADLSDSDDGQSDNIYLTWVHHTCLEFR